MTSIQLQRGAARVGTTGPRAGRGITLIELMIVVAVVAILAGIAYPSYESYILRSRRAAALAALEQIASQQEQYFMNTRTYTTDIANDLRLSEETEGGHYALTAEAGDCGDIALCYTLGAAPQGGQADDACATLSLTSTGQRLPAGCW